MKQDVIRYSLEVGSEASSHTALLCGSVNTNKDQVGFKDALVYIGREEEVAAAAAANDILKAGLVDGEIEVGTVPRVDTRLIEVDDGDLDVGALQRDDRARRATLADA